MNIWRSKAFLDGLLWNQILSTALTTTITKVDIPVYCLHRIHAYTVTWPETKAYFEVLNALLSLR